MSDILNNLEKLVEMLQDLILAAVNEALRAADADKENTLGRMAPAGMGGLF